MGLDTTHNAWHGPYSSFNDFRHRLASEIGINLNEYIGYNSVGGTKHLESIDHPLRDLFDHSDCDGILTPEQCKTIGDGLQDIIIKMNIPKTPEEEDFIEKCLQFQQGCYEAYAKKEILEFN